MTTCTLTRSLPSGTQLRWLTFDRPPEGYREPGQFVQVEIGGGKAYFAIASAPGRPLELLVKEDGDAALALAGLQVGDTIEVSSAMGEGFGASATHPRHLVCLVNGSALSAVRPVIEQEVQAGLVRPVSLLLGVLTPDRQPFADDLARWAREGVAVHVVVDPAHEGWSGLIGFVQLAAQELGLVRDDVAVVACGVPPMQDHAAELYREAGLDPSFFLTNF